MNLSLEQVAQIEGVTKARIRQIEQGALKKLRRYIKKRDPLLTAPR